ncbi:MAG: DUF4126 family protein [Candidatus Omnitrophica bacterium]|nr:DUF4126 family protein [Candidatus Omnitrophota bacterium]
MDFPGSLGLVLGGSWASGVNLYLTIAALGIADRLGLVTLPGGLDVLSHPVIIAFAVLLFAVEFFADKIPYVDSAWDSLHTLIRPVGGAAIAYMASRDNPAFTQMAIAMLGGTVALDAHLTKATTRVAINTSPEPFTNVAASVAEDSLVLVALWLMIKHPLVATVLVVSFVVFSIWFLRIMFDFLKKALRFFFRDINEAKSDGGNDVG